MTPEEQNDQIRRAKAALRLANSQFESGLVDALAVEQAQQRLLALQGFEPDLTPGPSPSQGEGGTSPKRAAPVPMEQLPLDVRQMIEQLTQERNQIHAEKSKLANDLVQIPDEVNAKQTVRQILDLRQAWRDKQDQIYQVMQSGRSGDPALPTSASVEARQLPVEPDRVRFQINRLQSNINKLQKRMAQSKELGTKRRQEINLAQMQGELQQLKSHLATL